MNKRCLITSKYRVIFFRRIGIVILFLALFSLRIIALDSDMPNYGIAFYQQIDEGPYAYLALHKVNYGCINPDILVNDVNQYTSPHLRMNILGNLITYVTILLFGDNYYGLRMGSILCMLINYILIYKILCKLQEKYSSVEDNKGKRILILFFSLLLFDFTYTLASRIVEVSIYRMLCVLLGIYIIFSFDVKVKLKNVLLGFVSVFSVFGIYITNIFFVFACVCAISIGFVKSEKKKAFINLVFYGIGAIIAILLCEAYMQYFWNTNIIRNCLQIISNFSNVEGYIESGGANRINYFINFWASSFNLYNPGILLLTMAFLPINIIYLIKKKDEKLALLIFSYLFMLIQTLISEDYIIRKYIIISPIVMFMIYIAMLYFKEIMEEWSETKKVIYINYVRLCSIFTLGIYIYRFKLMTDNSTLDFQGIDKRILFVFAILIVAIISTWIITNVTGMRFGNKIIILLLIFNLFAPSIYMNYKYIYSNLSFCDKRIMTELSDIHMESNYVVGQYMESFSLYNDCIPVVNYHDEMRNILLENKDLFYFDYATSWNPAAADYIEWILSGSGYHLVLYKEFERNTKTLGIIRNVALYKVEEIESEN